VCVTAAALYEEGFELHWHALREGQLDPDESFDLGRFQAADDLGTDYLPVEPGGASWSEREGPSAVQGESRCETAVPRDASELHLKKGEAAWLIRLR
jgi:hypothetical protein